MILFLGGLAPLVVLLLLATAVVVNVPATLIKRTCVPDHPVFGAVRLVGSAAYALRRTRA